jgi:hypothetical protein
MKHLIAKRHPHGMVGVDHPENIDTKYYSFYNENIRIRKEPNSNKTFFIDR